MCRDIFDPLQLMSGSLDSSCIYLFFLLSFADWRRTRGSPRTRSIRNETHNSRVFQNNCVQSECVWLVVAEGPAGRCPFDEDGVRRDRRRAALMQRCSWSVGEINSRAGAGLMSDAASRHVTAECVDDGKHERAVMTVLSRSMLKPSFVRAARVAAL